MDFPEGGTVEANCDDLPTDEQLRQFLLRTEPILDFVKDMAVRTPKRCEAIIRFIEVQLSQFPGNVDPEELFQVIVRLIHFIRGYRVDRDFLKNDSFLPAMNNPTLGVLQKVGNRESHRVAKSGAQEWGVNKRSQFGLDSDQSIDLEKMLASAEKYANQSMARPNNSKVRRGVDRFLEVAHNTFPSLSRIDRPSFDHLVFAGYEASLVVSRVSNVIPFKTRAISTVSEAS